MEGDIRIGITGHQRLADPTGWQWVTEQINGVLSELPPPLVGLTSLAIGTDQIFAKAILQHGGIFRAIIPFAGYEEKFPEERERTEYERLLKLAAVVEVLQKAGTGREAYFQAGKQIVHRSEVLLAVWDRLPAARLGGTADVVEYALAHGKPMITLNPITTTVQRHGELAL